MKLLRQMMFAAVLLALSAPSSLLACAACYGKSDSPLASGMNWGIFTLLGVIVTVLASIATFFAFIIHKGAALDQNPDSVPQNPAKV